MSLNLATGSVYTFNTLAPGILQATVKNAKLKGILDYEIALKYDNVDTKFRQIYPVLPPGTVDNPESCTYYLFTAESGEKIVLADQWIDEGTVVNVEGINFQFTFMNKSLADMNKVRDLVNAAGITDYQVKQL